MKVQYRLRRLDVFWLDNRNRTQEALLVDVISLVTGVK
ncbi:MAG: hypothetical protein OFPII_40670 [Osedax symbiont Rs1]|nr:MAG: hypothetical protein OFPII_40670 [Osedax symbiont Rs1]